MTLQKLRLITRLYRMRRTAASMGLPVGDMPLAQFYRKLIRTDRVLKKAARASGITAREAGERFSLSGGRYESDSTGNSPFRAC